MAKGKMGERVSEDAQLKLTDLVVDCGYKAGKGWDFLLGAKKVKTPCLEVGIEGSNPTLRIGM